MRVLEPVSNLIIHSILQASVLPLVEQKYEILSYALSHSHLSVSYKPTCIDDIIPRRRGMEIPMINLGHAVSRIEGDFVVFLHFGLREEVISDLMERLPH